MTVNKMIRQKRILYETRGLYEESPVDEARNVIIPLDISSLALDELNNMCFHHSLRKDLPSISMNGLKAKIGRNSQGIDEEAAIYFSYGLEAVLETCDVSLKWRMNRLFDPKWQEENTKMISRIKNGLAIEEEKKQFYSECDKWNNEFISGAYKEDIKKLAFLFEYQFQEMQHSIYYTLALCEGKEFTFDEIDTKKLRVLANKEADEGAYMKQRVMYGDYSDNDNIYVDKWNMNTVLGKDIIIMPDRMRLLQTKDGKTDVFSIVLSFYNTYKENIPFEEQVHFDLLDGYIQYVKSKVKIGVDNSVVENYTVMEDKYRKK